MPAYFCGFLGIILGSILLVRVIKYGLNAFLDLLNLFTLFFIGYCLLPAAYWNDYDGWLVRFIFNLDSATSYTVYVGCVILIGHIIRMLFSRKDLYLFDPLYTVSRKKSDTMIKLIGVYVSGLTILSILLTRNLHGNRFELLSLYTTINSISLVFPLFLTSTCYFLFSENPRPSVFTYLYLFVPFVAYDLAFQSRTFIVFSLTSLILSFSRRRIRLRPVLLISILLIIVFLMRIIEITRSSWLLFKFANSPFETLFSLPGEFTNSFFAVLIIETRNQVNPLLILYKNMFFFLPQRLKAFLFPDVRLPSDVLNDASSVIDWGLGGNLLVEFFHSSSYLYVYIAPLFMVLFFLLAKPMYQLNFYTQSFYVISMLYLSKFFRAGFLTSIFECLYFLTFFLVLNLLATILLKSGRARSC